MEQLIICHSNDDILLNIEHISNSNELLSELFNVPIINPSNVALGMGRTYKISSWDTDIKDTKNNCLNIFIYKKHFLPIVEYKYIVEYLNSIDEDKFNLTIGFIEEKNKNYTMWVKVNTVIKE